MLIAELPTVQARVKQRIADSVRIGLCVHQDLQDLKTYDLIADEILEQLVFEGVVVKVDRELPKDEDYDYYEDEAFDDGQRSMVEAGYEAVEPLIK